MIEDPDERGWLASLARRLHWGIETLWNAPRGLYHESVHRDGTLSDRFSIHPQFLTALYGAADDARGQQLLDRIAGSGGRDLEGLASPFALHFYCEALEKFGREAAILDLFRAYYTPMVEAGTTLWEALPESRTTPPGFPTRSHCHGWSACPAHFLPRIVLGIRPVGVGAREFVVSPQPHGLTWARGCVTTPHGPVVVRWETHDNTVVLDIVHPEGCEVRFETNEQLAAFKCTVRFHPAANQINQENIL